MASSSEWVPTAVIRPSSSSATRSASCTVDGRCATISAVVEASTVAQRRLDQRLGVDVERRQRVVEHEHRGLRRDRPGEREPLPLSAREAEALLADRGVEPVGQVVDEVGLRDLERLGAVPARCRADAPSSTLSRTDAENSVASSNAIAMCVRSSSPAEVADVDPVEQ